MIDFFEEARELLAVFEERGVPYALAGAVALAVHGAPRATTDIDVLVPADAVTSALAAARLRGFDIEAMPMRFSDGMEVRRVKKIDGAEMLTLDLLVVNDVLQPVFDGRVRLQTADGAVWAVSREGLIEMKAWANRAQDVADIARLRDLDR